MLYITIGEYTIHISEDATGKSAHYAIDAQFIETLSIDEREDPVLFLSVTKGSGDPLLVVKQPYSLGGSSGFHPGILLVPETQMLFIGTGWRISAYSLNPPARLWEDRATGFWYWKRHGQVILMLAEVEFEAWDIHGEKLWSAYVEPPWDYTLEGDTIHLDVMGKQTSFPLRSGPAQ